MPNRNNDARGPYEQWWSGFFRSIMKTMFWIFAIIIFFIMIIIAY